MTEKLFSKRRAKLKCDPLGFGVFFVVVVLPELVEVKELRTEVALEDLDPVVDLVDVGVVGRVGGEGREVGAPETLGLQVELVILVHVHPSLVGEEEVPAAQNAVVGALVKPHVPQVLALVPEYPVVAQSAGH